MATTLPTDGSGTSGPEEAPEEVEEAKTNALQPALAAVERALEIPIVVGETEVRAEGIRRAVERARDSFRSRSQGEHRGILREIAETDAGLLPRVTRLEHEARDLLESWEQTLRAARELGRIASTSPRDEAPFRESLERFAPATMALVLKTRAHESALRTWLNEALHRDRGIGD